MPSRFAKIVPDAFLASFFRFVFGTDFLSFLEPFLGSLWPSFSNNFRFFVATSIFHVFWYLLGSVLGAIATSKVSVSLRTSFKNH